MGKLVIGPKNHPALQKAFVTVENVAAEVVQAPIIIEKRVEVEVVRHVEVPVDRVVEKIVHVEVPTIVEKIVHVEKIVEVPVDRVVKVITEVEKEVQKIIEVPKLVFRTTESIVHKVPVWTWCIITAETLAIVLLLIK